METLRHTEHLTTPYVPGASSANDDWPLTMGHSSFPEGAVARIFKPSRSVTTSGRAATKGWRLTFERRTAPFIEPLMGWTGGDDTLTQLELSFPTLESALRYAKRQGLAYTVHGPNDSAARDQPTARSARGLSDSRLEKLGLKDLQESYERAIGGMANRNDSACPATWASPTAVVRDRNLSLKDKRSTLINWAWTEHLIEHPTSGDVREPTQDRVRMRSSMRCVKYSDPREGRLHARRHEMSS
jgi:NADH dehydrogenase ubiquinone Fe-S protein 4